MQELFPVVTLLAETECMKIPSPVGVHHAFGFDPHAEDVPLLHRFVIAVQVFELADVRPVHEARFETVIQCPVERLVVWISVPTLMPFADGRPGKYL